jgi:hypothetical protein
VRTRSIIATVAVALACVGSVSPASAQTDPAAGDAPPITVAEAKQVVDAYNLQNAHNNDSLDIEGQGAIEADPILAIDDANFRETAGRGETTLHEDVTIGRTRVFVPAPSGGPQHFLVSEHVTGPDSSFDQLLLFGRASAAEPWKVSLAAQLDGPVPNVRTDRDGNAALVDADHAAELRAKPDTLAGSLAALWARDAGDERAPVKIFKKGSLTTGAVDEFVNRLASAGVTADVDFDFDAEDTAPVCYRTADDGALCFFVVAMHETLHPTGGDDRLVQQGSRSPLGGLVVPGQYGSVKYDRLGIVAAAVPPRGAKHKVDVLGLYDGTVTATTEPVGSAPPGPAV